MAWTMHNDFVAKAAEVIVRGDAAPNENQYYLILCNPVSVLTRTSTIATIIGSELIQGNGYAPIAYAPGAGSYDSGQQRYEFPDVDCTFTASGGTLQFNHCVLWQGRGATANKPVASVNTSSGRLTVTAHGGTNGDRVLVTSTVANPAGISATTLYYLKTIATDTVELYTDSGLTSIVNITDAGSGDITLRWANGYPALLQSFDTINVSDGNSLPVTVGWSFLNTGNVNGV